MTLPFRPGRRVPDIRLGTMGGTSCAISDFAGRKVLVYVWASWDASREDLPLLQKFIEKHPGLDVVTIACDAQGIDHPMRYISQAKLKGHWWIDATCTLARRWSLKDVGATVLLDENRCVALAGGRPDKALLAKVEKALGRRAAARRMPEPKVDVKNTQVEILMQACTNLLTRRRVDDAIEALRKACAADPGNRVIPPQTWALKHPERFYAGPIDQAWLAERPPVVPRS